MDNERVILSKQKTLEVLKEWHEAGMIMWENLPKLADEICNQWIRVEDVLDIRMRVWMPYSLKQGLDTGSIEHEETEKDKYKLNEGWQWVEFVAINDPLQPLPSAPEDK